MPKAKKDVSSSDSDSGPDDHPPAKKSKASSKKAESEEKGEKNQWVLEKMRQVRINEFKGRMFVDIREYYEKGGELLPGKKGISLSPEQWKKLLSIADEVNQALEKN